MQYEYTCGNCDHIWERQLKLSEYKTPIDSPCPSCEESGNISQYFGGMPVHIDSHKLGIKKPDAGFREVMAKIHEKSPGSELKNYVNW